MPSVEKSSTQIRFEERERKKKFSDIMSGRRQEIMTMQQQHRVPRGAEFNMVMCVRVCVCDTVCVCVFVESERKREML